MPDDVRIYALRDHNIWTARSDGCCNASEGWKVQTRTRSDELNLDGGGVQLLEESPSVVDRDDLCLDTAVDQSNHEPGQESLGSADREGRAKEDRAHSAPAFNELRIQGEMRLNDLAGAVAIRALLAERDQGAYIGGSGEHLHHGLCEP